MKYLLILTVFLMLGNNKKELKKLDSIFDSSTIYVVHTEKKGGNKITKQYTIKKTNKKILIEYTVKKGDNRGSKLIRKQIQQYDIDCVKQLAIDGLSYQNGNGCGTSSEYAFRDFDNTVKFTVTDCSFLGIIEWGEGFEHRTPNAEHRSK